jgi:hypothetical protein
MTTEVVTPRLGASQVWSVYSETARCRFPRESEPSPMDYRRIVQRAGLLLDRSRRKLGAARTETALEHERRAHIRADRPYPASHRLVGRWRVTPGFRRAYRVGDLTAQAGLDLVLESGRAWRGAGDDPP